MIYLYDTNIIIGYLNDDQRVEKYFDPSFIEENDIYLSQITRIELLSFPGLEKKEEKIIISLVSSFEVIPITNQIEIKTVEIRKKFKLKIPDAVIVATAEYLHATLVTADEAIISSQSIELYINPMKP